MKRNKIFDCFTYFNEDMMLNIRLNELNKFVDYFCIVECAFDHQGNKKKQCFNINNFEKFKHKIKYLFVDTLPQNIHENLVSNKWSIENYQRNCISKLLTNADDNDIVIISDLDEIPKLKNFNIRKKHLSKKYIIFQQKFFYYKFNNQNITRKKWAGSKSCLYKNLSLPQKIRDLKTPNIFNIKKRFFDEFFINSNGGWHFSFIMDYQKIKEKIQSYGHREYNNEEYTNIENIKKRILSGEDILKRGYKFKKMSKSLLPDYVKENIDSFSDYLI